MSETNERTFVNNALPEGVEMLGHVNEAFAEILTPEALKFVRALVRKFSGKRQELLDKRVDVVQEKIDGGWMPDFLPETVHTRNDSWTVAPIPLELHDRRVEITGPASSRKMVINALNSGANVFMADAEDSESPTWENIINGQINLRDAIRGTISYESPEGKGYSLNEKRAVLMFRPRGWHLEEKHVLVDGKPVSASLFDFCLYFYHNARQLIENGSGPYFYLPKLESHLEARLWNDVFALSEGLLDTPYGTTKATVLIETILAAFEMHEILYELKDHSAGLNCGRWDYIFSVIKKFRNHPDFVMPDRATVTMENHFLKSYVKLLIETCHKRGVHAMGGMAAQIPIKSDPEANIIAMDKVRMDKLREVAAGHDGTWVAHPGLVEIAKRVFDGHMTGLNQLHVMPQAVITAQDLLTIPPGDITEKGLRTNINVGVLYFEAWLKGNGCVPLYNLMEDAATAEISRAQVWQWLRHKVVLSDGRQMGVELFRRVLREEMQKIKSTVGETAFGAGKYQLAAELFDRIITNEEFTEFLTLTGYDYL